MNCFSCCQWEAQPIKCEISWTHWGQSKLITQERTLPDSELSFLTAAYSAPVFLGFAFPFSQRNCLSSLFLIQTGKAVVSAYNFPKEQTWLRCSSNPVGLWVGFFCFCFFPLPYLFSPHSFLCFLSPLHYFIFLFIFIDCSHKGCNLFPISMHCMEQWHPSQKDTGDQSIPVVV